MSLDTLSTELQQTILGYLDFISLLAVQNTNTYWRKVVDNSLSKSGIIPPARIKLLHLYQELHLYPSCLVSRKDIVLELQPFSRTEYLSTLQSQIKEYSPNSTLRVPAEFELWILEWPEHAVIDSIWPSLESDDENMLYCVDAGERFSWSSAAEDSELMGLYLKYHGCTIYSTLFFECGEERDGMVWSGDICELAEIEEWEEDEDLAGSWIEWLRRELRKGEASL